MNRREFLMLAAGAVVAGGSRAFGAERAARPLFGACRGLEDVPLMKALGYDFFENGVAAMLQPDKTDDQWRKRRDELRAAPLPLRSCNGFLPGKFRLTGPKASFDAPLAYAEIACRRADLVGVKTIVFGSGAARNAPKDFPKEKAVEQFTDFCAKLAPRIAGCKVEIVLEPLRPKEANYLNFVREGAAICRALNAPRIRLLADIYHMMEGGEGAESIEQAGALLRHCHIAEKHTRTAPGLKGKGDEFRPYFKALKKIGYAGGISCECGWGGKKKLREDFARALDVMKRVWAEA